MFIAMNQFSVAPERADDFEKGWRERESHLATLKGFRGFALLKGDEPGDYISHTTWRSREDFMAWATSDAFRSAHANPMPAGIILGHPRARFYEAVIIEQPAAATASR
jgi:heme-degrading monooxygenase HmoA